MREEVAVERVAPYSEEAERGVLGSILLEPARCYSAALAAGFGEGAWYVPAHRCMWLGVVELMTSGHVDVLLLAEWLKGKGWLEQVGGQPALDGLIDSTPTAAHCESYVEIVREKWLLRSTIGEIRDAENRAYGAESGETVAADLIGALTRKLAGRRETKSNEEVARELIAKWREATKHEGTLLGMDLPYGPRLTQLTCGLEPGLFLLAGRPGTGKTTMEDEIACWTARQGIGVARFTLDSSRGDLMGRELCRMAGTSLPRMKFGYGRKDQFARQEDAAAAIGGFPMWIDDQSRDIRDICARARALKVEKNIGLMTLDFVQLVRASVLGRSQSDQVAVVSYVSGELKGLGYELGIPVLVLSQLSREVEKDGRRPRLTDLRDSGCLEQDANKVAMLSIDKKKAKEMEEAKPEATKHKRPVWFDFVKHKDGETGCVPMWMYPPYFRFEEAVGGWDAEGQEAPEWTLEADENEEKA